MKYTNPLTGRTAEITGERTAIIRNVNWEDVRVESQLPMVEQLTLEWYIADESPMWEKSDGYHTFNELYDHRTALFAALCTFIPAIKSLKHHDDTMFDDMFIVMTYLNWQQISYHLDSKYWDIFPATEVPRADERDWHTSNDVIERLLDFVKSKTWKIE